MEETAVQGGLYATLAVIALQVLFLCLKVLSKYSKRKRRLEKEKVQESNLETLLAAIHSAMNTSSSRSEGSVEAPPSPPPKRDTGVSTKTLELVVELEKIRRASKEF